MTITVLYFILVPLSGLFVFLSFRKQKSYYEKQEKKEPLKQNVCIFSGHEDDEKINCARTLGEFDSILKKINVIGKPQLQYDKHFIRYMSFWKEECIDTTRAVLVTLRLQGKTDFIKTNQKKLLEFVDSCFHGDDGGYSIIPKEIPSVYATSNAIEVIKDTLLIENDKKLINDGNNKFKLANGNDYEFSTDNIFSIKNFLKKTKNGFSVCDEIGDKNSDAICVIYLAWRLLWNLDKVNIFFDLMPHHVLMEYIEKCYRKGGFASREQQKEPSMANTYFALSLIKKLFDNNPKIYDKMHDEFFTNKNHEISNFINKCWDSNTGGFSASIGSAPSLNSTYFAIYNMKLLKINFESKQNLIKEFIKRCYCQGGGFAITINEYLSPKVSLAHAARWVFQIDKFCGNNILNENEKIETNHFLNRLYNSDKGGFSGLFISNYSKTKDIIENCHYIKEYGYPLDRHSCDI